MLATIESIAAFVMRPHRNRSAIWWICVCASECVDFFWEDVDGDGDGDVNIRCACVCVWERIFMHGFCLPVRPPTNQLEFPL